MMGFRSIVAGAALLAATVTAQSPAVATYSNGEHSISVNVPSDTASSGAGPIFFQISAPSGTAWTGFGQGSRMSGSNMFIIYADGNGNVTLSPRLGTGHAMPQYDSSAQVTLLGGSGVNSDGSLVANVRCDSCSSWSGGSMSFTSTSSSWIYASKSGSSLDSTDTSESISQHDQDTTFSLDLTSGTGGSSSNPFVAAASSPSSSASAGSSSTAASTASTASATNGVSAPIASTSSSANSDGTSNSASGSGDNSGTLLSAHGIIMSVLFLGLFPFASLTLYLPTTIKVRYIHAPLQILALILLIVGMALGIVLGQRFDELDGYHMIIGFVVVACMILFQPAMGLYQHLHYHKTGGRSAFGIAHRWLGRTLILLGIVNGGLGWYIAGNTSAYIPYGVVAGIVFLIYISVLIFASFRSGRSDETLNEKPGSDRSYEMQRPKEQRHRRLSSDEIRNNPSMYQQQNYQQQNYQQQSRSGTYTISGRR